MGIGSAWVFSWTPERFVFWRLLTIAKPLRTNDQIRISPIRVIDQDKNQLGVMPTAEALNLAREAGIDLVEVSPTEKPPVCRLMDYGKHKYDRKKRLKIASHGQTITIKEIRMRPKTDVHDREIKMSRARRFLGEGHKVQFTMLFRGRERMHRDMAFEVFNGIVQEMSDLCKLERPPRLDGRRMVMVVAPLKSAGTKSSDKNRKPAPQEANAKGGSKPQQQSVEDPVGESGPQEQSDSGNPVPHPPQQQDVEDSAEGPRPEQQSIEDHSNT